MATPIRTPNLLLKGRHIHQLLRSLLHPDLRILLLDPAIGTWGCGGAPIRLEVCIILEDKLLSNTAEFGWFAAYCPGFRLRHGSPFAIPPNYQGSKLAHGAQFLVHGVTFWYHSKWDVTLPSRNQP